MPHSSELSLVDQRIWRACAGSSVDIPTVNSRVYYFPQGHLEQSSYSPSPSPHPPPLLSGLAFSRHSILCQISDVKFLADPVTDEVYAKLHLLPLPLHPSHNMRTPLLELSRNFERVGGNGVGDSNNDDGCYDDDSKVLAFAKILTPSDANNGGGFSVPRFCADSIFPPLNYQAEPPVQTLTVTDIHGMAWDFRHIYRGTPRRHLLTTGWSKFVNHKKLVAGDSVVFMRNLSGDMFIGVRRAVRFNNSVRWRKQIGGNATVKTKDEEGFLRAGTGKFWPDAVAEAVERAAQGLPFEVVYYPKAGWYSDFVVRAEVVDAAFNMNWAAGMRVKMAMETEDSSRITWFNGTITGGAVPDSGPWQGSPWRMLQISWDDPEVLQNAKRVSPWQVEFVAPASTLQATFPPSKKFKFPNNSGFLTDGEGELFFRMSGLTNSTMGHMNASLLNCNTFPAGMQGARQDSFPIYSLANLLGENAPPAFADNAFNQNMVPSTKRLPTELSIGNSLSENLSPDSQSSMHSFGTEFVGNRGCNSKNVGISSFQLFGKVIHMNEPVQSSFDVGCIEDDGSKVYNEAEDVNNALDLTLTSSYTELLHNIDVKCQRASAVEACSL